MSRRARLIGTALLCALLHPAPAPAAKPATAAELWSFQPFSKQPAPSVKDPSWPRTRADLFILSAIEKAGLTPAPDAEPEVLARRLYFDLIGLPPSPEAVSAFTAAARRDLPQAIASLADRLLASPDFGPRWARHWLDVARFAESSGNTRNMTYPQAWRYRNYVIRAFNNNTPFDQFIREQIAGDLLPAATWQQHDAQALGTGFLNIGTKSLGEMDTLLYEMNVADDQIEATCRAFLGLSAACARCHDHKFDPIPTADYYAMAGIFRSTKNLALVETNNIMLDKEGLPLGPQGAEKLAARERHEKNRSALQLNNSDLLKKHQALHEQLERLAQASAPPAALTRERTLYAAQENKARDQAARLAILQKTIPAIPALGMGVSERDTPLNCALMDRGDHKKPLQEIPRGALSAIPVPWQPIATKESGRKQLADWIAHPQNPLTARVAVNRIWQHLFGQGLVPTPDDFGKMGQPPSHPRLLDDLAARFVEDQWDIKTLIRTLVTSRAYCQSSTPSARATEADGENRLLSHMNRKRLDAEPMRDAMLFVSATLDRQLLEGSQVATLSEKVQPQGREIGRRDFIVHDITDTVPYRSIYLPVVRGSQLPVLQCFNAADPSSVVGARTNHIIPVQSLFLMNSGFVMDQAQQLANRVSSTPPTQRIQRLWQLVFSRPPTAAEQKAVLTSLGPRLNEGSAWPGLCQTLLMTAEFQTVY